MIWFKISPRCYIDVTQIREFGMPKDRPDSILITWKDGHEDYYYGVENQEETFNRLAEFVETIFNPIVVPENDSDNVGMILNTLDNSLEVF